MNSLAENRGARDRDGNGEPRESASSDAPDLAALPARSPVEIWEIAKLAIGRGGDGCVNKW
jgi:hypothetical protein